MMGVLPETVKVPPLAETERHCLELLTMVVRGEMLRRRVLTLNELLVSSTVAQVKKRIQAAMDGTPDEIHMMVGSEPVEDSTVLSSLVQDGTSQAKAIVWYSKPEDRWDWGNTQRERPMESEPTTTMAGRRNSDPLPANDLEYLAFFAEALPALGLLQQQPPPLLMRPRVKRQADHLATDEERAGLQEGALFELTVNACIFLGSHTHRRSCVVPVSGRAQAAEVEARLEAWLGSRPDELSLTMDTAALVSHQKLEDCGVGPGKQVFAVAWYQHASNRDLPPRGVSRGVRRHANRAGDHA